MRGNNSHRRKPFKTPTPATGRPPNATAAASDALDPFKGAKKPPTAAWGDASVAPTNATRSAQPRDAKAAPKSSAGPSRAGPAAKASAKPATTEQQLPTAGSARASTTATRPSNVVIVTQSPGGQSQRRVHTTVVSPEESFRARKSHNSTSNTTYEEQQHQAFVLSPLAAGPVAPRRAKTAGPRGPVVEPTALVPDSPTVLSRSAVRSATVQRHRQATAAYADMGEALAENQQQVTDILDAICRHEQDATAVLLRVIRSAPQVTAECLHHQQGEMLLLRTIQAHTSHAVLLCYGCVLMRKLCHLSIEATELFVRNGILSVLAEALDHFPEDAILQASACGCLAVLAQSSNTSKNLMLQADTSELNVTELVLNSLAVHSEYSNLTRQVQIYSCEVRRELTECMCVPVLTELADYGGSVTSVAMIGYVTARGSLPTMELLVSLLRRSTVREDKKVSCVLCTLLLCLAANSSLAAEGLREHDAISDLSVVMAKYPVDEGAVRATCTTSIVRFSAAALREIAATSLHRSPSKRVHQTARVILDSEIGAAQVPERATQPSNLVQPRDLSRTERGRSPTRSKATGRGAAKSTSRGRSKSPGSRPTTSASGQAGSFGQFASTLSETPGASFFTASPAELMLEYRAMGSSGPSRLQLPRSREEHARPGMTKRGGAYKSTEERDRLLMKTYGNPAYAGLQPTGKANRSSPPPPGSFQSGTPIDPRVSRVTPLRVNNFTLPSGLEPSRFKIPSPLSSDKHAAVPSAKRARTPSGRLTPLAADKFRTSPRSPDVARVSFSDKLHRMIEFAESSMYEASVTQAVDDDDDNNQDPDVRPLTRAPGKVAAAESKSSGERSTAPQSKRSGYKQTRSTETHQQQIQPTQARQTNQQA
ncbi:hypothetical protein PybrP1_011766, partial [[Pythium] brassicae (nom. inval.)]